VLAQVAPGLGLAEPRRSDLAVVVRAPDAALQPLARRVSDLLVGRLASARPAWRAVLTCGGPDEARGLGADLVLELILRREGPRLLAEGTLARCDPGFWETALGRPRGLLAQVLVDAPLPRLQPVQVAGARPGFVAVHVQRPADRVAGLAAVDLDGDGQAEVIAAGPERVAVWRLAGGWLSPVAAMSLRGLPRAPRPSRTPLAQVAALVADDGPPRLLVWTGRLARPTWLALEATDLRVLDAVPAPGVPLAVGPAGWLVGDPERTRLVPRGWWTPGSEGLLRPADLPPALGVVLLGEVPVRVLGDGRMVATDGRSWDGVGAATSCDLDGDGTPELVAASDALPGEPDRLRVLGEPGQPDRWVSPRLDGPIWALACGDVDGDGLPEALAVPFSSSRDAWLLEVR